MKKSVILTTSACMLLIACNSTTEQQPTATEEPGLTAPVTADSAMAQYTATNDNATKELIDEGYKAEANAHVYRIRVAENGSSEEQIDKIINKYIAKYRIDTNRKETIQLYFYDKATVLQSDNNFLYLWTKEPGLVSTVDVR